MNKDARAEREHLFGRNQQRPTPDECIVHWQLHGVCLYCHSTIRHAIHLFNHYNRWHVIRERSREQKRSVSKPQFYFWDPFIHQWRECLLTAYFSAREVGLPTAYTKEQS